MSNLDNWKLIIKCVSFINLQPNKKPTILMDDSISSEIKLTECNKTSHNEKNVKVKLSSSTIQLECYNSEIEEIAAQTHRIYAFFNSMFQ